MKYKPYAQRQNAVVTARSHAAVRLRTTWDIVTTRTTRTVPASTATESMKHERNRARRTVKRVDGVADRTTSSPSARWRTRLIFDDRKISFLLDCGATVNLIPASLIRAMGRMKDVRPTTAKLRMFDSSELQTSGVITLTVNHPHTARLYNLDFYVATKNDQPLLDFEACSASSTRTTASARRMSSSRRQPRRRLLRAQYCMPTIDDVLPQLSNARVFTAIDARGMVFGCVS